MNKIFMLLLIFVGLQAGAQDLNKKKQDTYRNKEIMINNCTRESVCNFPEFKSMYDTMYESYEPDSTTITSLKPLTEGLKVTIIMGTWCGDSKLQVPHFYKITDQLGITEKDMTLVCVDGQKKAENGIIDNLDIQRVPTFIFYKDGKELGRIVESPKDTLEKDSYDILAKK
jgi:thiol-disulfide isomerase/thioredoxin